MKCKDCPNDLGYRSGMHWPPYVATCGLGKNQVISKKGELYNRKCKRNYIAKLVLPKDVDSDTTTMTLPPYEGDKKFTAVIDNIEEITKFRIPLATKGEYMADEDKIRDDYKKETKEDAYCSYNDDGGNFTDDYVHWLEDSVINKNEELKQKNDLLEEIKKHINTYFKTAKSISAIDILKKIEQQMILLQL